MDRPSQIYSKPSKNVRHTFAPYFLNSKYFLANIIINFTIGVILGPTSFGLVYYILFVLAYEILIMVLTQGSPSFITDPLYRLGYIAAGLAGYIFGRSVAFRYEIDPLDPNAVTESIKAMERNKKQNSQ